MVFIVAMVLVASRTRMAAAVLAAVLCFLAYNFFFIEPKFTILIGARQGVTTVILFLVATLAAGRLASQLRMQVLALRAANTHATVLQGLGRQLSSAADLGQVLQAARTTLERSLGMDVWLCVDKASDASRGAVLEPTDRAAADWVHAHGKPAGRHTDTLAGAAWWFLPLRDGARAIGVMGLNCWRATGWTATSRTCWT